MVITTLTHHSDLGQWTHSECVPAQLLPAVEKLWHFEGRMELLRERSFPRVYSEIILHLGPRFRDVAPTGERGDYFPESCFGGATTLPSVIEAPNSACCVIGIQLHAAASYHLLGFSPRETNNITISLGDALGADAETLAERCSEANSVQQRFQIVCQFLQRALARQNAAHRAVQWASAELRNSDGRIPIAMLQQPTSLSKARFVALFREQTGFAPKHYARILRFRHAMQLLQVERRLSNAALSAGYYDQAHMQNEFREFAQMTPAQFLSAQRFPNSMTLPESG